MKNNLLKIKGFTEFLEMLEGNPNNYALQQVKGGYFRVNKSLSPEVIEQHVRGELTIGLYLTKNYIYMSTGAIDLDAHYKNQLNISEESMDFARAVLNEELINVGFKKEHLVNENSGGGIHCWINFDGKTPIISYLSIMEHVRNKYKEHFKDKDGFWQKRFQDKFGKFVLDFEIYPEHVDTSKLKDGLGRLIRMPGFHQKRKLLSEFTDAHGNILDDITYHEPMDMDFMIDEIVQTNKDIKKIQSKKLFKVYGPVSTNLIIEEEHDLTQLDQETYWKLKGKITETDVVNHVKELARRGIRKDKKFDVQAFLSKKLRKQSKDAVLKTLNRRNYTLNIKGRKSNNPSLPDWVCLDIYEFDFKNLFGFRPGEYDNILYFATAKKTEDAEDTNIDNQIHEMIEKGSLKYDQEKTDTYLTYLTDRLKKEVESDNTVHPRCKMLKCVGMCVGGYNCHGWNNTKKDLRGKSIVTPANTWSKNGFTWKHLPSCITNISRLDTIEKIMQIKKAFVSLQEAMGFDGKTVKQYLNSHSEQITRFWEHLVENRMLETGSLLEWKTKQKSIDKLIFSFYFKNKKLKMLIFDCAWMKYYNFCQLNNPKYAEDVKFCKTMKLVNGIRIPGIVSYPIYHCKNKRWHENNTGLIPTNRKRGRATA